MPRADLEARQELNWGFAGKFRGLVSRVGVSRNLYGGMFSFCLYGIVGEGMQPASLGQRPKWHPRPREREKTQTQNSGQNDQFEARSSRNQSSFAPLSASMVRLVRAGLSQSRISICRGMARPRFFCCDWEMDGLSKSKLPPYRSSVRSSYAKYNQYRYGVRSTEYSVPNPTSG